MRIAEWNSSTIVNFFMLNTLTLTDCSIHAPLINTLWDRKLFSSHRGLKCVPLACTPSPPSSSLSVLYYYKAQVIATQSHHRHLSVLFPLSLTLLPTVPSLGSWMCSFTNKSPLCHFCLHTNSWEQYPSCIYDTGRKKSTKITASEKKVGSITVNMY